MNKTVTAFVAGGAVAMLGVAVVDVASHLVQMPAPSAVGVAIPLTPMETSAATVYAGSPNFRAAAFAESPDKSTMAGVWAADGPSKFEWSYGADEAVYIQEGQVHIDYQGKTFTLKPGDMAYFHAGTKAVWSVPQHVRKSWTIHHTSRFVRWYRQLTSGTAPA